MSQIPTLPLLRTTWTTLYSHTLPTLALSHAPSQPTWPVHLDHCFARIIYDAVIGEGVAPWPTRLKSPAVAHMSAAQLQACIAMGDDIAAGRVGLADADEQSLAARGKKGKRKVGVEVETGGAREGAKRKREERDGDIRAALRGAGSGIPKTKPEAEKAGEVKPLPTPPPTARSLSPPSSPPAADTDQDTKALIASSALSPFRMRVLLALTQVPPGKYTTYAALADFLGSAPRAVGNAMRNNPFAPAVPCHRVLAADGGIGGFGGEWGGKGGEGERIRKKRELLRSEGVRFDGRGRVVGGVWRGFV
ncbi:hypothetical protein MMC17_003441 [Xylographa soralifera]|nr:hypothetical protein [Xylographa soralifera]